MRKKLLPINANSSSVKAILLGCAFMLFNFLQASNGPLTVSVIGENPSCFGTDDGSVTAIADGGWEPYTYEWNTGDTTATVENLGPGTYTVTVVDIDLAIAIGSITLVSDSLTFTTNSNFETCEGSSDAFAAVFPEGGTPPYSYSWDTPNMDTSWVAENLSVGTYNVTITDANGCSVVAAVTVELSPEGLWVMSTFTDATCPDECDGTAYVGAMTGTPPFEYIWTDPDMQTTAEATGLCPGQYFVTVTDVNGCTNLDSVIISAPSDIIIDLDVNDFDCQSGDLGSITATVSGGTPPYSYEWDTGDTTAAITDLDAGTYVLTVTDANDCEAIASAVITGANPDAGTLTADGAEVCLVDSSAQLVAIPNGDAVVPSGYEIIYVLTSGPGLVILDVNTDPEFFVTEGGTYKIHTLVYDPTTLDLSIVTPGVTNGFDVNGLLVQGGGDICASLDVDGADFNVDDPDAGTLTATASSVCLVDSSVVISAVPDGNANVPAGYSTIFVLTSGTGLIIEQAGPDPSFTVSEGGLYTIHTLVYDPTTLDLSIIDFGVTTGFDVNGLLVQGGGDICASLDVPGAPVVVGNPDAGTLTADGADVCLDDGSAQLVAIPNGDAIVPTGYEVIYVLTSGPGLVIEATNTDPEFTVTTGGTYKIHTLVYDPNTLDLSIVTPGVTTGFDVNGLLIQGGGDICASLDVAGADFTVDDPDAGTLTATSSNVCLVDGSAIISATPDGNPNVPGGYSTFYVLTTGTGLTIVQAKPIPIFTVNSGGLYTIHTLVYDPNTLDLTIIDFGTTTGFDVNGLLVQGGGDICASLDVAGAPIVVEDPDAGTITADADNVCLDNGAALLSATPDGNANVPSGYSVLYVLTSGTGLVIEQTNTSPEFTVNEIGLYTIHTLVYDPNTLDLSIVTPGVTTGFDVNGLLVQGGGDICASLDVTGAPIVVEDCGPCVNIGDYVWYDGNKDGIQQDDEFGVPGFTVFLTTAGPDGVFGNQDDIIVDTEVTENGGHYLFECVTPGTYVIVFNPLDLPNNEWFFSPPNQGSNDELDSDADTLSGATDPFVVTATQDDDFSFDAGIYPLCLDLTYGGQIGFDQTICAGLVPDTLVEVIPAGGGLGDIEYLWMFSTVPGPFNQSTWDIIPGSNTPFYAPGPLSQTTYFIRCARRQGCEEFVIESNIVVITVIPYNPDDCGQLINNLVLQPTNNGQVALSWVVMDDQAQFAYVVEKSPNGKDFKDIQILTSKNNGQYMNKYEFLDENPSVGSNYYRIRAQSTGGMVNYSETRKVILHNEFSVFPNPVHNNQLFIKSSSSVNQSSRIEIYSYEGVLLNTIQLKNGSIIDEVVSFENYSRGLYLVKIYFGGELYEVIKVSNVSE